MWLQNEECLRRETQLKDSVSTCNNVMDKLKTTLPFFRITVCMRSTKRREFEK